MKFDDHEIWGAPVHAAESAPAEAAQPAVSTPAPSSAGRLYRSAGSEAHPDAIVALPNHQRRHAMAHTAAHPVEATSWADTGLHAPITINSLIPSRPAATPAPTRPAQIDDPAIAEVLGAGVAEQAEPPAGFTSWFRQATGFAPEPSTAGAGATRTREPRQPRPARALSVPKPELHGVTLSARSAALLSFVVTLVVAVANARLSTSLGAPTGIALLLTTAVAAWLLDAGARWPAWVLPPYVLIAVILVAGQFTGNAPGRSILGQAILVFAGLITLAPWLAASTVLAAVVPLLRSRTK